jgi:hypothetical protein
MGVPVSHERVEVCLKSAKFWVDELPRYADRQQQTADRWAIASGVLAAITSLSVWPILGPGSTDFDKALVSTIALIAATCALVPRIKNYAELAGAARELTSRYGSLTGELIDLSKTNPPDQERARIVVAEFQAVKEKKDSLRGLADRPRVELQMAQALAKARKKASAAENGVGGGGG